MKNDSWSINTLYAQIKKIEIVDLSLRLTLLDLILSPVGNWKLRFIILTLSCIGLLIPGQLKNPRIWIGLTIFTALRIILSWPLSDNHSYLLAYWCLAIAIALLSDNRSKYLSFNGRYLIGLVFIFATIWKLLLSPDYLDSTFFKITMLSDPRFDSFTRLLSGLNSERLWELRDFINQHIDGQIFEPANYSELTTWFVRIAAFLTFYTAVLELVIAIAFLWPLNKGISKYRDYVLILFCLTIYSIATVEGFGWLLIAMGISQIQNEQHRLKVIYLLAFAIILFYREIPWIEVLLSNLQ